jgi:hypothetical protein
MKHAYEEAVQAAFEPCDRRWWLPLVSLVCTILIYVVFALPNENSFGDISGPASHLVGVAMSPVMLAIFLASMSYPIARMALRQGGTNIQGGLFHSIFFPEFWISLAGYFACLLWTILPSGKYCQNWLPVYVVCLALPLVFACVLRFLRKREQAVMESAYIHGRCGGAPRYSA